MGCRSIRAACAAISISNASIMSDDFVAGGIIPDEETSEDDEFDPNAISSDDFLDDEDDLLEEEDPDADLSTEALADEEDSEDESTYFDPDDK